MQLQCGIFDSVGLLGICLHECGNYLRTFAAAPVCGSLTAVLARSFMDVFGGAGRDRTADKGFADLCLTTWRPRLGLKRILPDDSPHRPFAVQVGQKNRGG